MKNPSALLLAISLVALPALADAPAAPPQHKHHALMQKWKAHLNPAALKKIESAGAQLFKMAESVVPGGKALDAAMKLAGKAFPKLNKEKLDHVAALVLHHASEMIAKSHSAIVAKAADKARAFLQQHQALSHALEKLVAKIGPQAGEALKDLK